MAARTIQINSFCGGTSKLVDSEFCGMEESLNMYPETVRAQDTFSTKMLKSVEGFSLSGYNVTADYLVGMCSVCSNPFLNPAIKNSILFIQQEYGTSKHTIYNLYFDGTIEPTGTFTNAGGAHYAKMLELANGKVLILVGGVLYAADPSTSSLAALSNVTKPDKYDGSGKILPTQMAQLNFRVVLNDRNSDYIYWSEINRPSGSTDTHAFEQSITQYAYTKNDGTVVTFADNVFYPPAVGTYDPLTLTTQTVYSSALNSMKMDFKGDYVTSLKASDSSLFVFGSNSLQVLQWQNSTIAPFAIVAKTSCAGVDFGEAAAVIGNDCFFVGKGTGALLGVWVADSSGSVQKVSSVAIDQRLAEFSTEGVGDINSFGYSYKGHSFFVFSITSADGSKEATYAYDITEQEWSTRASFDAQGNAHKWNVMQCDSVDGRPVFFVNTVGGNRWITWFDHESTTDLYQVENTYTTEYNMIVKERTTGIKYDGVNDIMVTALELVLNNGITRQLDESKDGYNPKVMLQVSVDGGRTWSNELWAYAGRTGQYSWRTRWNSLGRGARFAFRVRMTDPVQFEIATAYLSFIPCGNRV